MPYRSEVRPEPSPIHLLIPFAAPLSAIGREALASLSLPNLERLLARLQPGPTTGSDEWTLTPPHEVLIGRALGWQAADGLWPFASRMARADGLNPLPGEGWGLLSPAHWHVGTDQISLLHPDELRLDEADSRAALAALRPLLDSEGWQLHWAAPTRWYAVHDELATLPCASLDRVIGRNIDPWLPPTPAARRVRRLQSEVQMLLYTHAINDAREARGALAVNSFWISDCGATPRETASVALQIDDRLRNPALRDDWAAWADDWRALDAGPVREALRRVDDGEPITLTLCGDRKACRFDTPPAGSAWRTAWRRLAGSHRRADVATAMEDL